MKKIQAILFNLVIGVVFASLTGGGAIAAVGIGGVLSLLPGLNVSGALPMAVQKEIWENDIIESLWADNAFLNYAINVDNYVLAGKVVHIPQAGSAPATKVNRTELPAAVTKRTDTDVTYAIDEITSDPVLIPNADTVELSYDKRTSVTAETRAAINNVAALVMLYNWAPTLASAILRTTGSPVLAHANAATGNRKAVALADLKAAQKLMNKNNVPSEGRYAMFDAEMYDQITNEMTANQSRDFLAAYDEKAGIMGKLYGFNILMRSETISYTNDATPAPKLFSVAGAAADNAAVICWQSTMVERALGEVKFFENTGDPTYYGDIYSSLVRIGGRKRRADGKGVIAIVQAASV